MRGPHEIEVVVRRRRAVLAPVQTAPAMITMPTKSSTPMPETNIVAQAALILGERVSMLREVRLLDGTPCDLNRLMIEANKLLAADGMPQLGRNPGWLA